MTAVDLEALHRTLGELGEIFISDDRRDLNNRIGLRAKTCHLKVDPDQIGGSFWFSVWHFRSPLTLDLPSLHA